MRNLEYSGIIHGVTYASSSANGNPSWRVTFARHTRNEDAPLRIDSAVLRTATDSAVGYKINNSEYLGVPVTISLRDGEIIDVHLDSQ
jgi:hypothetical protein